MGHPVEEIVKAAKRSKADLIIMGSKEEVHYQPPFLGSVSYGVIHNDKSIPILIVRD